MSPGIEAAPQKPSCAFDIIVAINNQFATSLHQLYKPSHAHKFLHSVFHNHPASNCYKLYIEYLRITDPKKPVTQDQRKLKKELQQQFLKFIDGRKNLVTREKHAVIALYQLLREQGLGIDNNKDGVLDDEIFANIDDEIHLPTNLISDLEALYNRADGISFPEACAEKLENIRKVSSVHHGGSRSHETSSHGLEQPKQECKGDCNGQTSLIIEHLKKNLKLDNVFCTRKNTSLLSTKSAKDEGRNYGNYDYGNYDDGKSLPRTSWMTSIGNALFGSRDGASKPAPMFDVGGFGWGRLGVLHGLEAENKFVMRVDQKMMADGIQDLRVAKTEEHVISKLILAAVEADVFRANKNMRGGGSGDAPDGQTPDFERSERWGKACERFYRRLESRADEYYKFHENLFKSRMRWAIKHEMQFPPANKFAKESDAVLIKAFRSELAELASRSSAFYAKFGDAFSRFTAAPADAKASSENKRSKLTMTLASYPEKIVALYQNRRGMSQIVDASFGILCAIRIVRLCIAYGALSLAVKLFTETYMIQVYTKSKPPPSLYTFILYFLAIDAALNGVVLLVLVLINMTTNVTESTGYINSALIKRSIIDYAATNAALVALSAAVISVVVSKRYFAYELEGARAIRATKEIMIKLLVLLNLVPFFVFF